MKNTWFVHDRVDTTTANELLERYAARKIPAKKMLATDPRLWLVSAYLPEGNYPPRRDKTYEQSIWS